MDFNIRKPAHILALLMILVSIFVILILPILSYVQVLPSTQSQEYQNIAENLELISEIFILIFQLIISLVLFILIPIFWYMLVNNKKFKQALIKMRLKFENIDRAFLWAILAVIAMYSISFVIVAILEASGTDVSDLSNIPDIEQIFSPSVIFLLIAIMPIAEEIFFRGFLLDKINDYAGKNVAIFSTAFLFGIAHFSYGKIYPVIFPMIMGVLLAYIVFKTKNLFASIIAHIIYNVVVFMLYILAKSLI